MANNNANLIADILQKQEGEIRFSVDDVTPAEELLPIGSVKEVFQGKCREPLITFSHNENFDVVRVLEYGLFDESSGLHPLVYAVHLAFSQHRKLLLTPDIIWVTLLQGFSHHINYNSEALRERFVRHQGKLTLQIESNNLTNTKDWADSIDKWIEKIFAHIDPTVHRMMICDFTTTTAISRTVSQIVIMDCFQNYFDYRLAFVCGIPQVTLKGTVEDWLNIKERVQGMAQYGLDWWTERLLPICDGFIATAQGRPNLTFWKNIYQPESIYGGKLINGWLAELFPYCKDFLTDQPTVRNRIFVKSREGLTVNDGISADSIPLGLSQVPFLLETSEDKQYLKLVGGFIGVCQDKNNGQLYPEMGWGVVRQDGFSPFLPVIEKIFTKRNDVDWAAFKNLRRMPDMPKELIQLLEELGEGTFFADTETPWVVRSIADFTSLEIVRFKNYATQFIDLKDGRRVCYDFIVKCNDNKEQEPENIGELWFITGTPISGTKENNNHEILNNPVVIAKGVLQFFERMIKANGSYYFDLPDFVPDDVVDLIVW